MKNPKTPLKSLKEPSALGVLKAARRRIARPGRWTKNALMRDKNGNATMQRNAACSACAVGHVMLCTFDREILSSAFKLLQKANEDAQFSRGVVGLSYTSVPHFNDMYNTTQADVVKLFDRAIELAKSEDEI